MDIVKSSRHSRITGDFGEALVLYWLSKHGLECARVDHTGLDLIARNPGTGELMGVSVKSRSRNEGKEQSHVHIDRDDLAKAQEASAAFGCVPYFAVVVDAADVIRVFITSLAHMVEILPPAVTSLGWKMRPKYIARYQDDPEVKLIELRTCTPRWWRQETK